MQASLSQDNAPTSSGSPIAQVEPLTLGGKFDIYLSRTYGPGALLRSAASAGFRQWLDSPPEWGQGAEGYGRRLASSMGSRVVKNTVQFGVGAALREDPRYFRSDRRGFFPRSWHAIASTFVARKDNGERAFATSRFAGALAAGFVSNSWYPERLSDTSHAFARAGVTLGTDAGVNILREFWPDVKRLLGRR